MKQKSSVFRTLPAALTLTLLLAACSGNDPAKLMQSAKDYMAQSDHAAAIDPMAPGMDLKPLLDLLVENDDVLKVFHAGGQDVEIIFNLTGKTPRSIFDTQIGQMALGQAEQVGYSNLVEAWLGLQLD